MTTNRRLTSAALIATASLAVLGGCAKDNGSGAANINTPDYASTAPSETWHGTGKAPPPKTASAESKPKKSKSQQQWDDFRNNPTPELQTLSQRPADVDNAIALDNNENFRMMWEDWGRLWLFERPSRLSPVSIPH